MNTRTKVAAGIGLGVVAGAIAVAALTMSSNASAGKGGILDDGKELLPQAGITLDEAIASARTYGPGNVDEVDLEYWHGTLVFNVDVGDKDVKVDAATGEVLGAEGED